MSDSAAQIKPEIESLFPAEDEQGVLAQASRLNPEFLTRFTHEDNLEILERLKGLGVEPRTVLLLCFYHSPVPALCGTGDRVSREEVPRIAELFKRAAREMRRVLDSFARPVKYFGDVDLATGLRAPIDAPDGTAYLVPLYECAGRANSPGLLEWLADFVIAHADDVRRPAHRPKEEAENSFIRWWAKLAKEATGRPLHAEGQSLFAVTFGREIDAEPYEDRARSLAALG